MSLFKYRLKETEVGIDPLVCNTPAGKIFFQFSFNNKEMSPSNFKTFTENNAIISSWHFKECEIEFFRADFIPSIPPHMKVDYCTAGIWRVKSLNSSLEFKFKTFIDLNLSTLLNKKGTLETGEGLVSCSYENNEMKLSIGTEDEDFLASRAQNQQWMPNRFKDLFLNESVIKSIPGGLEVNFPQLEVNETIQVQFIIAVSSKAFSNDSTWFAVEQDSNFILNQYHVS